MTDREEWEKVKEECANCKFNTGSGCPYMLCAKFLHDIVEALEAFGLVDDKKQASKKQENENDKGRYSLQTT